MGVGITYCKVLLYPVVPYIMVGVASIKVKALVLERVNPAKVGVDVWAIS